jgi:hypothetical protein
MVNLTILTIAWLLKGLFLALRRVSCDDIKESSVPNNLRTNTICLYVIKHGGGNKHVRNGISDKPGLVGTAIS